MARPARRSGHRASLGGLKTGRFDAIMAVPAWQFAAEDLGFDSAIYDISDDSAWDRVFGGNIPASVVYVLDSAVEANAELTQKYVNAMYRSMGWLGESSVDEVYAVIGEQMPRFSEDQVKKEIAYYKKIFRYDGDFPKADFETGAKVWFRDKTKMDALAYDEVVDLSFLETAKKS